MLVITNSTDKERTQDVGEREEKQYTLLSVNAKISFFNRKSTMLTAVLMDRLKAGVWVDFNSEIL